MTFLSIGQKETQTKRNTEILPSHNILSKDACRDVYRELRGDMEGLKFMRLEKTAGANLVFHFSSSICISVINLDTASYPCWDGEDSEVVPRKLS